MRRAAHLESACGQSLGGEPSHIHVGVYAALLTPDALSSSSRNATRRRGAGGNRPVSHARARDQSTSDFPRSWRKAFRSVLGSPCSGACALGLGPATVSPQSACTMASGRSAARVARTICAACGATAGHVGRRCALRGPFGRRRRRSDPVLARYAASALLLALLHAVRALPWQSIPSLSFSATT